LKNQETFNQEHFYFLERNMNLEKSDFMKMFIHGLTQREKELGVFHVFEINFF